MCLYPLYNSLISIPILTIDSSAFLTGFPFMVTIIDLPQRFQIINDLSPVKAGIRMLPLLLSSAVGAGITGVLCSKKNLSSYLLVFANALQIVGTGLFTTLPVTQSIATSQYGFQIIMGLAFGMSLTCLIIIARVESNSADHGKFALMD